MSTRSYTSDTRTRPFGIQLDVESLKRRRAVSQVLSGGAFKDELESILKDQVGGSQKRSVVLKKLQETVIPVSVLEAARQSTTPLAPPLHVGELVIPINDLRGSHASKYTIPERQLRCKLASVCRLSDLFGWSSLIHNLVTAVCSAAERSVLANAFGLMSYEVTASNLVKIGLEGDVSDHGGTQFGVDHPTLPLHLALHAARQDIRCVIPVSNAATVAVSCMNCGLLGISERALMVGKISYTNPEEDIGLDPTSKILFVRGQGLLAFGQNIEEAFHYAYHIAKACEIQVSAITAGVGSLSAFSFKNGLRPADQQREFEGLMRMLDNKGYNTGYEYKCWDLFQPPPDASYEVRKKERELKRIKVKLKQKDSDADCCPLNNATSHVATTESAQSDCRADFTESKEQHISKLREDFISTSEQLLNVPMASERSSNCGGVPPNKSNTMPNDGARAEVNSAVPDTRRHPKTPFIWPLEQAMNTAKQVAHSTHQAVEKLILQELSGQDVNLQPYNHSSAATVRAVKSEATPAQLVTPGLLSSNGQWHSPVADEGGSRQHIQNSVLFYCDQVSAEKAANAARVVAKSTAEAVRKMSGSMKEPVASYLSSY